MTKLLSLVIVSLFASSVLAQPKIKLVETQKKVWAPDAKASIAVRYKNVGTLPLIVSGATIDQGTQSVFQLTTSFTTPKIVLPGDSSYVSLDLNATIAYEYNCTLKLLSNDPLTPQASVHIRANDSVSPNPVRDLRATPGKDGSLSISWLPPFPAWDNDSITQYKVFVVTPDGRHEQIYGGGKQTAIGAKTKLEGDVFINVLAYDDMGNRSVGRDTTWADHSPPKLLIERIDQQSSGIPDHIARGLVPIRVISEDEHPSKVTAISRSASGTEQTIGEREASPLKHKEHFDFSWNTSNAERNVELVIRAVDDVGNEAAQTIPFQVTQIKGWPKRMINSSLMSAVSTGVTSSGTYLLTGSIIANGAFTGSGNHFYHSWPLSVDRSTTDRIVTSMVDTDGDGRSNTIVGSSNNEVLVLDHNGTVQKRFGVLSQDDRYFTHFSDSINNRELILTGPSPVAFFDASGVVNVVGTSQAWTIDGVTVELDAVVEDSGVRERDRYSVADLNGDKRLEIIAVQDKGEVAGEWISVYNTEGELLQGWPQYIHRPTGSYNGFYPSIGDVDNDGSLDIVLPAANDSLYVFDRHGSRLPYFPAYLSTKGSGRNQALIADLTYDGYAEIILPANDSISAISGGNGRALRGIWPLKRNAGGATLLTIDDVNADGYLELVEAPAPVESGDSAWVYSYDLQVLKSPSNVQWGAFQYDMKRSGVVSASNAKADVNEATRPLAVLRITDGMLYFGQHTNAAATIVDITGRTVWSGMLETNAVNVSEYVEGLYFLTVGDSAYKFIIQ